MPIKIILELNSTLQCTQCNCHTFFIDRDLALASHGKLRVRIACASCHEDPIEQVDEEGPSYIFTLMPAPRALADMRLRQRDVQARQRSRWQISGVIRESCHHSHLVRWQDDDTNEMHPCVTRPDCRDWEYDEITEPYQDPRSG